MIKNLLSAALVSIAIAFSGTCVAQAVPLHLIADQQFTGSIISFQASSQDMLYSLGTIGPDHFNLTTVVPDILLNSEYESGSARIQLTIAQAGFARVVNVYCSTAHYYFRTDSPEGITVMVPSSLGNDGSFVEGSCFSAK